MTKISKSLLISSLLSAICAFPASANVYVGTLGTFSNVEYQPTSQSATTEGNPILLQAQAGYFINDYMAIEGRYGMSAQRDNNLSVDYLMSGYAKVNLPVSDQVALYGLAGVSSVKVDLQGSGSTTASSASLGLGAHYAISAENALVLEFVNSSSKDTVNLNGFSLGFQHRFK